MDRAGQLAASSVQRAAANMHTVAPTQLIDIAESNQLVLMHFRKNAVTRPFGALLAWLQPTSGGAGSSSCSLRKHGKALLEMSLGMFCWQV